MPSKHPHGLPIAGVVLAGAAAFGWSLKDGFVWDDDFQIVRNPFLHASTPWHRLFTTDVWGYTEPGRAGVSNYYRPLQMVVYKLAEQWAGLKPSVFHAVNLAFHLAACVLVYAIFWQITRRRSWAAAGALIFALQPIHSEAVIWVSALTELGCGLFYFAAFWLFLLAQGGEEAGEGQGARRRRWGWIAGSCALFFIALLWKEMALTLPVVIGAYAFWFDRSGRAYLRRLWPVLRTSSPYWATIAPYLFIRFRVLGFLSRVQHAWQLAPTAYALTDAALLGKYWAKLALPVNLNAFYVFHPVLSWAGPRPVLAVVFLAAAATLIVLGLKRAPLASFAIAWTFLTLAPVLALRQVGMNVFTERYLYIPSLGFCLLLAWMGGTLVERRGSQRPAVRWAVGAALAALLAFYAAQDVRRIPDWRDNYTLSAKTVEQSPDSALLRNSLAGVLRDEKHDLAGAERQYLAAIAVGSTVPPVQPEEVSTAYVGLAGVYSAEEQFDKALGAVRKALKIEPNLPDARLSEAIVLLHLGRPIEARMILLQLVRRDPNDEDVLNALGAVALTLKEYAVAMLYFQQAVKVVPSDGDAWNNLGRTEGEMGQMAAAIPYFETALALDPANPIYHTNLGVVYARLGRLSEARAEMERALALAPDYAPARADLAALARLAQKDSAPDAPK